MRHMLAKFPVETLRPGTTLLDNEQLRRELQNAVERANKTLRGITGLEVIKENAAIDKGKIVEYRSTLLVTFVLDS